jgi:hypothetical protein
MVNSANDTLTLKYKPLSDKKIQNNIDVKFLKRINCNYTPTIIEDNSGRRFEQINYKDTTQLLRILNDGHYKLFKKLNSDNSECFILTTTKDTTEINKKDKNEDGYQYEDRKYIGQLKYLARDIPGFMGKAERLVFSSKKIQDYVHQINQNFPEESKKFEAYSSVSYLHIGAKTLYSENQKNLVIEMMTSHYKLDLSTNLSFRFGLTANYYQRISDLEAYYSINSVSYTGAWGVITETDTILVYPAHQLTATWKLLETPAMLYWEATNWPVTPFYYVGISVACTNLELIRTNNVGDYYSGWKFNPILVGGIGLKAKIADRINLISELKFDFGINQSHLMFGAEYVLPMKKLKNF